MENISVTQGTGSWGNTLLLQEPCACQGQSVGETALRTVVAGFCPPSCTACVRVPAAGLVGWIALGNAPDQGKFGLFTFCYNEEPFWGMTSSPLCYSLWRAAPGQCLWIISRKLEPSEQCFTAFPIDSWMHSIYIWVYCGLMHELSGDNT